MAETRDYNHPQELDQQNIRTAQQDLASDMWAAMVASRMENQSTSTANDETKNEPAPAASTLGSAIDSGMQAITSVLDSAIRATASGIGRLGDMLNNPVVGVAQNHIRDLDSSHWPTRVAAQNNLNSLLRASTNNPEQTEVLLAVLQHGHANGTTEQQRRIGKILETDWRLPARVNEAAQSIQNGDHRSFINQLNRENNRNPGGLENFQNAINRQLRQGNSGLQFEMFFGGIYAVTQNGRELGEYQWRPSKTTQR